MRHEAGTDIAIFNSGSIRIDDVVPPGPVTQYDVIRVLPFGGKVVKATFAGAVLAHVLQIGEQNKGTGGYLQNAGLPPSSIRRRATRSRSPTSCSRAEKRTSGF